MLADRPSPDQFDGLLRLPHESWIHVLQRSCDFGTRIFEKVSLNLLKNPNINSSLLFRADILYDSKNNEFTNEFLSEPRRKEVLELHNVRKGDLPGFKVDRTILRRMIPRNPQLDKPILQTCVFLSSLTTAGKSNQTLVIYIPHASSIDEIPWYHPRVRSLAYLHSWDSSSASPNGTGLTSLHYQLFSSEDLPLSPRLERTGQNLISTIYKHGQGELAGYQKRVHHDQLVSQQRVQDTYTELKKRHAQRLCDNWAESTESSKHVFEDLGIAAFLIELWRDMYGDDKGHDRYKGDACSEPGAKQPFVGFVDIGCGNGVLVDILVREGYRGWGFDARKRKSWATFNHSTQKHLKEMILIPEPFSSQSFPALSPTTPTKQSFFHKPSIPAVLKPNKPRESAYHNGIFPPHTFIVSNHADELTPWTPLLASLSDSPFLCIPCCSHNLSGQRFRAPSGFNGHSADILAPNYFAGNVSKAKHIPITVAGSDGDERGNTENGPLLAESKPGGVEKGDLKALSKQARAKQPSAYASLCDWVENLAVRVGYEAEREMLRLPSTRNLGIVARGRSDLYRASAVVESREAVMNIISEEKADAGAWIERAKGLQEAKRSGH